MTDTLHRAADGSKTPITTEDINTALIDLRKQLHKVGAFTSVYDLHQQAIKLQLLAKRLSDMALTGGTWGQQ